MEHSINFTKMHGTGNDFVIIDEWDDEVLSDGEKSEVSPRLSKRCYGIGADGVIFVRQSARKDIRMQLINPDGSEADMCGNGARCLVRYAVEAGYVDPTGEIIIETPAGPRIARYSGNTILVNMGSASFEPSEIPATRPLIEEPVAGHTVTACNTGVPHAVVFVDGIDAVDVAEKSHNIKRSGLFPQGINVNFAEKGDDCYEVRTFERGVEKETQSCGTGSTAVAAAARLLHGTGDKVTIRTHGGDLDVRFEDNELFVKGPARRIFEGQVSLADL
jgi:diaminopimelate epimerase